MGFILGVVLTYVGFGIVYQVSQKDFALDLKAAKKAIKWPKYAFSKKEDEE